MSAEPNKGTSRRNFLARLTLGVNALTALLVAAPAAGYLLSPLLNRRQSEWVPLGPATQFGGDESQVAFPARSR